MSNEESQFHRPSTSDLSFKLDPKLRAELQPAFDVDALEALLQRMDSKERKLFLGTLGAASQNPPTRPQSDGSAQSGHDQEDRVLIRDTDPARQALLDKMWAPYWDLLPKGAVDDPGYPYPGRELARLRQSKRGNLKGDSRK